MSSYEEVSNSQSQLVGMQKEKLLYRAMLRDTVWMNFSDLTEGVVESISLGSQANGQYDFSELSFPMPFNECMTYCADNYIQKPYQKSYLDNFCIDNLHKLHEEGKEFLEMDFPIIGKRKELQWLRIRICVYIDDESGHLFGMSFAKDITEEVILRESEHLSHDIIKAVTNSYECIYYWDIVKNTMWIEQSNEELEEFVDQYSNKNFSEISEEYVNRFVAEEDRGELYKVFSESNIQKVLPKKNIEVEYRKRLPNGEIKWIRCMLVACNIKDGKVESFVHGLQDITEQKEIEANQNEILLNALAAAEQASQAKTDFLSRMSHDIRTPMNAIVGMTAIAATHIDDRDRIMDCLSKITLSSKHLLALINEVLDMSKLESNKLELSMESLNISEMMFNLISMLRMSINEKNHEIRYQPENLIHEDVICDGSRLQQVMVNLITNAIKYTPEGGKITVIAREAPTRTKDYYEYQFIVEDNGIGMKKEFLEKIFQPFERAEDSRISKIHGTGLGTAIAQGVVKMMNGNIKVESTMGEGSRFTVTVPLRIQEREDSLPEKLMNLPVLVVDDEEDDCLIASRTLDSIGMKSDWVLSGAEAVEKVVSRYHTPEEYFAIFLDWKMPEMDGVETTRKIREQVGEDIPIIVLTAYDWGDIEEQARDAGVTGFLSKPINEVKLYHLFGKFDKSHNESVQYINEEKFIGKQILLVEDNDLNAEIARELLKYQGFNVAVAENGKIAVDMLLASSENYYSCVLMDIQMPVMDGYTATNIIRNEDRRDLRSIPIVAMTADAFLEDIRKAYECGMNEHIAKPIDIEKLKEVLNDLIA